MRSKKIRDQLTRWYRKNQRDLPWRRTNDPYAIWVSEVMLQQTRVSAVIPYFLKFMRRFPDVHSLAKAELEAVLKTWEGMGYYARARNLHRAAEVIVRMHHGVLPSSVQALKSLPGVGDYIAAAVASIAFKKPAPVVDGNVKRVLSRVFLVDTPVNASGAHQKYLRLAEKFVDPKSRDDQGVFNQAIMELGALICNPRNPGCPVCPISSSCLGFENNRVDDFPKRKKGKKIPQYHVSAAIVRKNGKILITRRRPDGHLGGLWEFPGGKVRQNETAEQACIREVKEEVNLEIKVESFLTRIKHAYSHFKIVMDIYNCTYQSGKVKLSGPVDHRWTSPRQLKRYPFPGADRKFMDLITDK